MLYSVLVEHCGFCGTERTYKHFNTLMEAYNYYKKAITAWDYNYAGNDYHKTHLPMIIWQYEVEKNSHNFYTSPNKRITYNAAIRAARKAKAHFDDVKDVEFDINSEYPIGIDWFDFEKEELPF